MLRIPPRSSDSPWNNGVEQVKLVSIHLEQTEVVGGYWFVDELSAGLKSFALINTLIANAMIDFNSR
jgi:hypothetical protein